MNFLFFIFLLVISATFVFMNISSYRHGMFSIVMMMIGGLVIFVMAYNVLDLSSDFSSLISFGSQVDITQEDIIHNTSILNTTTSTYYEENNTINKKELLNTNIFNDDLSIGDI